MKSLIILFLLLLNAVYVYPQNNKISGIVFLDENKDGIYNNDEKTIENVAISNQEEIVLTNSKGEYSITMKKASFLYVIKPSGYQVALNTQNFQQNYYFYHVKDSPTYLKYPGVSATGNLPRQINFPLYHVDEEKRMKVLVIGDPQTADNERLDFFRDGGVSDMLRQKADFYIVLGDIADDYLDIYPREKAIISMLKIPGYHVAGNHDVNYKSKNKVNNFETFRKEYGPDYYSFNYNKTHFIVLNNINYFGWNEKENKRGDYFGGLDKTQLKWLKNDINLVPDDYLIVLNSHIPFLEKYSKASNTDEVNKILADRKVVMLSGHTHAVQTYWNIKNKNEGVIAGAACGSWWTGPNNEDGVPVATSVDGTPKGYFVFQFSGTDYDYKFIPANHSEDYQIRITLPLKTEPQYIRANWFVGKPNEKVTISFDGGESQLMENFTGFDPFMERTLKLRKNIDNWTPGLSETEHLWKIEIPKNITKGLHKIEITAVTNKDEKFKSYKIVEIE